MMATENSHWRTLVRFRPLLREAAEIGLLKRLCSRIALYLFASNIHRADWIAKASSMVHEFSLRERAPLSPRVPRDFFSSRCLAELLLLSLPGLTHSVDILLSLKGEDSYGLYPAGFAGWLRWVPTTAPLHQARTTKGLHSW